MAYESSANNFLIALITIFLFILLEVLKCLLDELVFLIPDRIKQDLFFQVKEILLDGFRHVSFVGLQL